MIKENKERLARQTIRRRWTLRMKAGLEDVSGDRHKLWTLLVILLLGVALFVFRATIMNAVAPALLASMLADCAAVIIPVLTVLCACTYMIAIGTPPNANTISDDMLRAGVVNDIDEPPVLMHRTTDPDNSKVEILDFHSVGIPRTMFEERQPQIEAALDRHIINVLDNTHRNRVLLYTVPANAALANIIYWSADRAAADCSTLVMGQTVAGTDVTVRLADTPHIMIGGSTGSGKSVLLKLLLKQCIDKGMEVYIADFKGGVDFARWENSCTVVLNVSDLLDLLSRLVTELEHRKQLLRASGVSSLGAYNDMTGQHLRRIVFACDEVAELLDKTGANKEQKADIDRVVNYLSTIARQGRAFGIHLILATQRPDANVLPGQIKNNMDVRACGRADNVLSQIILDSTAAADLIPKNSHKFLLHDGTIFQPYMITDESEWRKESGLNGTNEETD